MVRMGITPCLQADPSGIDATRAARIRRKLLRWFDREQREMPWRGTSDPYRIWISETMLQQTQVATVIPYYERFIDRFPTVRSLAEAKIDDVLSHWAGLGYYARARNLHAAARAVVETFGGRLPETVDELTTLPGVGRYTAGAVASIAFNKQTPVVDGNVARVLARLFEIGEDVRTDPGREQVWDLADRLLPRKRCGDFNQGLMELGATICLPGESARCLLCPLRDDCAARESGRVADLPVRTRPVAVQSETHVVAAIEREGRWLFVQRPSDGLWGGLWEMPTAVLNGGTTHALARRIAIEHLGPGITVRRRPFCEFEHRLTHRAITFVGHACRVSKRQETTRNHRHAFRWLALNKMDSLGISKAIRNVILALQPDTDACGKVCDL